MHVLLAGTGYGPEMTNGPLRMCSGRFWIIDCTSIGIGPAAPPRSSMVPFDPVIEAPIDETWLGGNCPAPGQQNDCVESEEEEVDDLSESLSDVPTVEGVPHSAKL